MVGLDASGKTSMLHKLQLGETVNTVPTIGFNVERVEYKNLSFTVWDVGGQERIRKLWRHYYQGANAVLFVVDCTDKERLDTVKEELALLVKEEKLNQAVICVLANKQVKQTAMTPRDLAQRLDLQTLFYDRTWSMFGTIAPTGDGMYESLDWLSRVLIQKKS
jgi:small GTP-binding protein